MQQAARNALHLLVMLARVRFVLVAWLLVASVVTQVFLAGLSIFAGAQNWSIHEGLGWALQLPVLALLVLAPAARLPWCTLGLTVLLLLLYTAQVLLIIIPRQTAVPVASALHPVERLAHLLGGAGAGMSSLPVLPPPVCPREGLAGESPPTRTLPGKLYLRCGRRGDLRPTPLLMRKGEGRQ